MTNQAILKPREEDRYLAVVVPKGIKSISYNHGVLKYYKKAFDNVLTVWELNYEGTLIGLLSNITEEQAKEMVNRDNVFRSLYKNYKKSNYGCLVALESLQSLIESSGLTYTSEQDVLLIKIN